MIPYYRSYLRREFERRKGKNPRYSMRAFARFLSIDISVLSKMFRGSPLGFQLSLKLAERLRLKKEEKILFVNSVIQDIAKNKLSEVDGGFTGAENQDIENKSYEVIGSWDHIAFLELTLTQAFQWDFNWISKALGISVNRAQEIAANLESLGLISEKEGKKQKSHRRLSTEDKSKTSDALRNYQKETLEKAISSLEKDPLSSRVHQSITMAIDPAKLPLAKVMISEFMNHLCDYLESENQERVYQMNLALFPLQTETS